MESAAAERLPSNSLPPIGIEIEDSLEQLGLDTTNLSPYGGDQDQASPKPVTRNREPKDLVRDKRPVKLVHHANKGKQQRDRRKLREKRRSTGVVHLASTESTGGSTTGDDEVENGTDILGLETRRNTQQNEVGVVGSPVAAETTTQVKQLSHSPLYSCKSRLRDKSPRSEDLEADDEQGDKTDNDHDSLNLSESSSAVSVMVSASLATTIAKTGPTCVSTAGLLTCDTNSTASTPVLRPTTPTLGDQGAGQPLEERLMTQLEEKDRRIQLLELKVEQLSQDTRTMAKEYATLQQENAALHRAINNLKK